LDRQFNWLHASALTRSRNKFWYRTQFQTYASAKDCCSKKSAKLLLKVLVPQSAPMPPHGSNELNARYRRSFRWIYTASSDMTFLGQFHFRSPEKSDVQHGSFSCLVEGDDPHDAFHAFECLIREAASERKLFPIGTEIYCDAVIETQPLPVGGVIAWFEAASGGCAVSYLV
jgi:hypothetical protein